MSSLLETLISEYSNEYNTDMSVVPYKLPKIYHGGKDFDLSQRWYVYYSYLNPITGKMQRQNPIYMNVNRDYNTVADRMKRLKLISKNLTELLKNGYSPYSDSEVKEKYTIKEAIEWAYELKAATLSDTSIPDYRSKKNQFVKYLEKHGLDVYRSDEFSKKYVQNYMNEIILKNSGKTHNNHKVVLSSFFEILKKNDLISENFIKDIDNQVSKPEKNKSYSKAQLDELFNEVSKDERLFLFVQFISYNILRPIEVARLKFEDLKIHDNPPFLQVKTKNKPLKTKLIPSIMLNSLQNLKFGNPSDLVFKTNDKGIETNEMNRRDYFSGEFKKIKDKLGLGEEYTLYSFRHTFITKLFRELRKERTELETYDLLMRITGHSTLKALKAYLRDIDAELAEDYSEFLE